MAKKKDNTLLYAGLGVAALFLLKKRDSGMAGVGAGRYKTTIGDFWAKQWGNGQYKIIYQSPATGRIWVWLTHDEYWWNIVKYNEPYTQKDLESLKWHCKNDGWESDRSEYRR